MAEVIGRNVPNFNYGMQAFGILRSKIILNMLNVHLKTLIGDVWERF